MFSLKLNWCHDAKCPSAEKVPRHFHAEGMNLGGYVSALIDSGEYALIVGDGAKSVATALPASVGKMKPNGMLKYVTKTIVKKKMIEALSKEQ